VLLFCECCSRCRFQPYDYVIISGGVKARPHRVCCVLRHVYSVEMLTRLESLESRFFSQSRERNFSTSENRLHRVCLTDSGGGVLVNELARFDPRHLTLTMLTPCRRLRLDPAVAAIDAVTHRYVRTECLSSSTSPVL